MRGRWSGCKGWVDSREESTSMSTSLETQIQELSVRPGSVACVWLGQAGYLFKSPDGQVIMVDPYLSEYAKAQWNMSRVIPAPIDPDILRPDILLASHWHEDHLDAPIIKQWAQERPGLLIGPFACIARAQSWGWPAEKTVLLDRGMSFSHGDFSVTAHFARHDIVVSPALDAVSFLMNIGGVSIWAICDTEYDSNLRPMANHRIDVALAPINGVGGNLTDKEAALLLSYVKPKLAIPNHYNMWAPETFGPGATLDPEVFVETYRLLGGGASRILEVGEIVTFSS